jgi:hypothetical protein
VIVSAWRKTTVARVAGRPVASTPTTCTPCGPRSASWVQALQHLVWRAHHHRQRAAAMKNC